MRLVNVKAFVRYFPEVYLLLGQNPSHYWMNPLNDLLSGLTSRKALIQSLPKANGLVVALLFSKCLLFLGWLCIDYINLFYVSFICLFQVRWKVCGNWIWLLLLGTSFKNWLKNKCIWSFLICLVLKAAVTHISVLAATMRSLCTTPRFDSVNRECCWVAVRSKLFLRLLFVL